MTEASIEGDEAVLIVDSRFYSVPSLLQAGKDFSDRCWVSVDGDPGGLLVVNEITTGMGRTGRWFGFEHYGLTPDLVAVGKGLGNGYPVSAVAISAAVAARLEALGFRYVQSHQNDPLGAVVAKEVIAEMGEGDWVGRGAALGQWFLRQLQELATKHPAIKEVRGRGMLFGLVLRSDARPSAIDLHRRLFERGFLLNVIPAGNLLRLDPALTIKEEQLAAFLVTLNELLTEPIPA